MLRVTFSIIVLESLRRIARWVVFAVITFFCKLANTTPSHPLFERRPPHLGVPVGTI